MYPNNGYPTQPQQERRRRSDRYSEPQHSGQASPAQGWQQPYQQPAPQQWQPQAKPVQPMPYQPYQQGMPQQPRQQMPQQGYGRGYYPPQQHQ